MVSFLNKHNFRVWLIGSGRALPTLERTLKTTELGHDLRVLQDKVALEAVDHELRQHPDRFPNLMMYLVSGNADSAVGFLREFKSSVRYRHVPIIILHTEVLPIAVRDLYALGASSVIRVPASGDDLKAVIESIKSYWFNVASPTPPVDGPLSPLWAGGG